MIAGTRERADEAAAAQAATTAATSRKHSLGSFVLQLTIVDALNALDVLTRKFRYLPNLYNI